MHAIAQQPLPPDLPLAMVGGVRAFLRPGHARPRICWAQKFNNTRADGNAAVDSFATHGMVRSATLTPYHSQPPARSGFHSLPTTTYGASCAYTRRPTHGPHLPHTASPHWISPHAPFSLSFSAGSVRDHNAPRHIVSPVEVHTTPYGKRWNHPAKEGRVDCEREMGNSPRRRTRTATENAFSVR